MTSTTRPDLLLQYRSPRFDAGNGSAPTDNSLTNCNTHVIVHRPAPDPHRFDNWRPMHRRPGIDPTDPAWIVAVAVVALVVLVLAVAW